MTENLLEAGLAQTPRSAEPGTAPTTDKQAARPTGLPDKFWDERKEEIRLDALIKSYLELERKLSTLPARDLPARPDEYRIEVKSDLLGPDPDVNQRLHAAGFSQDQVQMVYDLACERLMPMIAELASMFEADAQVDRLTQHFGGEERWREVARQIHAWGSSRLPSRVYEALATTYEGVVAMHKMMAGEEPGLLRDGAAGDQTPTETELKQLMRDPRYWKHQDPAIVERVRTGFRRLYEHG